MMLLAIETATDVCSVVFQNEEDELFEKRSETHGSHSENMFLFIEALMKEHSFTISDLETVLVSEGPGSYTGLRIAASGVKGLLFQQKVSLVGVNTLASFAQGVAEKNNHSCCIHAIIDARRKHVYHQKFTFDKQLKTETEVQIIPIKQFEVTVEENDIIIGTGLDRIDEKIIEKTLVFHKKYITAESLINLYKHGGKDFIHEIKPENFEPKYYTINQG